MSDAEEKPPTLGRLFAMIKDLKGKIATVLAVVSTLVSAYAWVDSKLDAIRQSTVDLQELKRTTASLRAAQEAANGELQATLQALRAEAAEELEERDTADRARDARITAVLTEMRARHGVIPLAGAGGRRDVIRAAEADEAEARRRAVVPTDPLGGVRDLEK